MYCRSKWQFAPDACDVGTLIFECTASIFWHIYMQTYIDNCQITRPTVVTKAADR